MVWGQPQAAQHHRAWPRARFGEGPRPAAVAAKRPLQLQQRPAPPGSRRAPRSGGGERSGSSASAAAADGGASGGAGDVLRPSAHAAAPPAAAPADLSGSSSSGGGGGSGGGGSGGGSGSGSGSGRAQYSSYADMYKALHATSYGAKPGGGSAAAGTTSASNGSSTSGNGGGGGSGSGSGSGHQHDGTGAAAAAAAEAASTPEAAGVEEAIRKAQQALAAAEDSLSSLHKLRSAQPPSKWTGLLQLLQSACIAVAAGALLVASHAFGLGWQWAGATLGALGLAARAYQRRAVTAAGAVAAAAACLATLGCSLRFGLVLLAFSYTTHKLRRFRDSRASVDFEALSRPQPQPPRDWPEVTCIALAPTVLAVAYGAMAGCLDLPLGGLPGVETWRADLLTLLQGAVLGWYACCAGDAWSTELGSLSADQPRLLPGLQPVRRGAHGAVTLLGLSGAAAGGLLVGLLFYCAAVLSPTLWVFDVQRHAALAQWRLVPLGLVAGLSGSLLDSLLGAFLQFNGYDAASARLSSSPGPGISRISGWLRQPWVGDRLVDVLSASLTAALTALAALRMFG